MKRVLLITTLIIGEATGAFTEGTNEIARIRGLIVQAESQARLIGARDADSIGEVYEVINHKAECVALQEKMAESWPFVLQHLKEVAPTESAKAMVLISFGKMTPRSYLEFLDALAGLVESGTLDRKYFLWAQFPPEGELSLFKQSAEPKARAVLVRARKIFQDLPDKTHLYDSILTGESKKRLEEYEARMEGRALPQKTEVAPATVPTNVPSPVIPVAQPAVAPVTTVSGSWSRYWLAALAVAVVGILVWLWQRKAR